MFARRRSLRLVTFRARSRSPSTNVEPAASAKSRREGKSSPTVAGPTACGRTARWELSELLVKGEGSRDGFPEWNAEGLPVESESSEVSR